MKLLGKEIDYHRTRASKKFAFNNSRVFCSGGVACVWCETRKRTGIWEGCAIDKAG